MKLYELKKLFDKCQPERLRFYNSGHDPNKPLYSLNDSLFFEFHFFRDRCSELFDVIEEETIKIYNRER